MKTLSSLIAAGALLAGCTSPDQSLFLYQLPYQPGSTVGVWQDHTTHSGGEFAIDMAGTNGSTTYNVVAARPGIVRFIEETNTQNCASGCPNNYVWIQHVPGLEWTKYSHLATGSVSAAGLSVGDDVAMGQVIGVESNIGMAQGSNDGRHLHFEVREVPAGSAPGPLAGDMPGTMRVPRFCIPGQVLVKGEIYTAQACNF
ncbi:M23 family metallopeptidase [Paracoccus aurantiacus]|uniref:M23 family metallopeptidase n=1 Tax=Paracoccus aurantiacus TaxID=2599412 RepID=A0A5C6S0Y9_9RHOB|nr:M23 family metallopeptidase [Paracoccus aurantiacus]TXB68033.1 M23 family metallopeptidase [Paracoccus aurantiacus]